MEHEHTHHANAYRDHGRYRPLRRPSRGARRRGGWRRGNRRERSSTVPTAWQERIERWVMDNAADHHDYSRDPDR